MKRALFRAGSTDSLTSIIAHVIEIEIKLNKIEFMCVFTIVVGNKNKNRARGFLRRAFFRFIEVDDRTTMPKSETHVLLIQLSFLSLSAHIGLTIQVKMKNTLARESLDV
jgi:hypothetical protein